MRGGFHSDYLEGKVELIGLGCQRVDNTESTCELAEDAPVGRGHPPLPPHTQTYWDRSVLLAASFADLALVCQVPLSPRDPSSLQKEVGVPSAELSREAQGIVSSP